MRTPFGIDLEIGQRWEEVDSRFKYARVVEVAGWDEQSQKVEIASLYKVTWAKLYRFNGKHGGYKPEGIGMRISVIVSDEEYREIKRKAGLVPLSAWLRDLALRGEHHEDRPMENIIKARKVPVGKRGVTESSGPIVGSAGLADRAAAGPANSAKTCKHGIAKGHHCWQCSGLAVAD